MWKFLPKSCDCQNTPTNEGSICTHTGPLLSEYVYSGEDLECLGISHNTDGNQVIQQLDYFFCWGAFTQNILNLIQNNPLEYQNIIDLINSVVDCNVINNCGPIPTTTTTSTTLLTTTTTSTTICNNPDVVVNGDFNGNLNGWNQTIFGSWVYSSFNFGTANYQGIDEGSILYQNILTPGLLYDISFDLWMNSSCIIPTGFYVKVYAGTTVYGPFKITGNQTINLILPCIGNSMFGIQAYDACELPHNTIFIDNVTVSEHCDSFTTTTTTTIPNTTTSTSTTILTTTTTTTLLITTTTTSTLTPSTTTTSTTILEGCMSVLVDANIQCPGEPGHANFSYVNCAGISTDTVIPIGGGGITLCVLYPNEPFFTCGNGTITILGPC